ncbi:MAG: hypothetical protein ACD_86C00003G0025 [uncultured bacterium]|nr:MAG: hypothetical protein ACD_86C00003G0025 [uncultured bacterium]
MDKIEENKELELEKPEHEEYREEVYSPHTEVINLGEGNKIDSGAPSIILSGEVGRTEEYRRSDHPDFMTSSELETIEFTGLRHNTLAMRMEIWTLGDLRGFVGDAVIAADPEALPRLHAEIFGLFYKGE